MTAAEDTLRQAEPSGRSAGEVYGMRAAPQAKYLSLALLAMQQAVAYRMPTLLTFLSNLVWPVILLSVWGAIFSSRTEVADFDWLRMRTYILVAYVVNSLVTHYAESDLMQGVRSGRIALDLLRPVDYMTAQFARAVGAAAVESLLGVSLALVLGVTVLRIAPPASPGAALLFVVSVALAFVVRFLISYLVSILCLWTVNGLGLMYARAAISNVFSGALIPLQLFPDWLRSVALVLPFQALVNTPLLIYLGDLGGAAALAALAVQLLWILVLWGAARALWGPCVRALAVQGG